MSNGPLYTIGYGGRSISDLVEALQRQRVRFVADVRSYPVSRHRPEYSKAPLERSLRAAGIRYVFLGAELGGRPDDSACYDDEGHVDYLLCRERGAFKSGIERLETAWRDGYVVALLCSEGRPEECHRTKLIAEVLTERGVEVVHIDTDGELRSHEEIMERLQAPQLALLANDSPALRSRRAYR